MLGITADISADFTAIDRERKITDFQSPVTRMLLSSNGSTTALLQAMLGKSLRLKVDWQGTRVVGDLDKRARSALRVATTDEVFLRISALCTEDGFAVSRHVAVSDAWGGTPIRGLLRDPERCVDDGLLELGLSQSRLPLAYGLADWRTRGQAAQDPCVARDCVILEEGLPTVYLCEAFNPEVAPIARALGSQCSHP